MGDIYLDEQLRRLLFPLLSRYEILLFLKQFFYRDTVIGMAERKKSVNFRNNENIMIAVREKSHMQLCGNCIQKLIYYFHRVLCFQWELKNLTISEIEFCSVLG